MQVVVYVYLMVISAIGVLGLMYALSKPVTSGGISFGRGILSLLFMAVHVLAVTYLFVK